MDLNTCGKEKDTQRNKQIWKEHCYAKRADGFNSNFVIGQVQSTSKTSNEYEEYRRESLDKKRENMKRKGINLSYQLILEEHCYAKRQKSCFEFDFNDSLLDLVGCQIEGTSNTCNEYEKHRKELLRKKREEMKNKRENLSNEQRFLYWEKDKIRKRVTRAEESAKTKQLRLEQQRIRQRVNRERFISFYAAGKHEMAYENKIGPMNTICGFCGGLHFAEEKISRRGNLFKDCCHYGKVFVPQIPEKNFPEELKNLFMKFDVRHVNFFQHIRYLNSSVSFASMNPLKYKFPNHRGPYCFRIYGQIYHKMNLALNPDKGEDPSFGQIFIVDTEQAMRTLSYAKDGIDSHLLRTVYQVIKNVNPFAEAYVMMKEEEEVEMEKARQENREPAEIKLLFTTEKQLNRRLGYNIPRANEVAAVYVPGAEGEVPNAKIVIRERGKELKILNSIDPMVTPMTYPLFYPRGTLGWNPGMKQKNSNKTLTRLQYVSSTLAIREKEFNPILYGGKLFQQYCVDEYVKIEGDRMNWIRYNQKKICAEAYKNIDNMLVKRAQEKGMPLGRKVILPPSVTNSPRYVEKHFQDAMAIVRRFGKPDLFLTMTCNPQWNEILENLFHEQVPNDRPDLVVRVFYLKLKALLNQIIKIKIFGEVVAWMYPVENQGRGLPHIHLLLTLAEKDKLINGEDVEQKGISARIPDIETEPELYDLVKKFMIHGPCGDLNPFCPCMEETVNNNGIRIKKCSKGYPKAYQEETIVSENGLAVYARPNDGRFIEVFANGKRHKLSNQWIVPHNLYLLKMFKCHINLEKVNSLSSVKYLHKYVHKPPDKARLELQDKNDHDEIKEFIDARYICPQEAVWRIFEFPMYDRSHCIMSLSVHLQGEQVCYFDENMDEEEIRERIENGSELMAFFELNKTNDLAKNLFYHQIPEKFCYKKGKWTERKAHFNTIGRMVKVSPAEPERYHLRLLLLNVKGACSYDDLKKVYNIEKGVEKECETFSAACLERGLIRNDEEWKKALEEAESYEMPWKLRDFFALILVHCNPAKPEELWEMFKEALSEDFNRSFSKELAYAKAYKQIALSVLEAGKTLADFPSLKQINVDDDVEQMFNLTEELELGENNYALMYDEQKKITDSVLNRIWNPINEPGFFFLSGPGGTGKTHVNKTIVHLLRGQKKKVCTMAFTGMAATLLPAGRTFHNRFGLTLDMSNSNVGPRSKAWQELKETDLFICDEAPMINKRAMKTLDQKLREIMNNEIAFGGKVLLWTGDFRQTLPIQKHATRAELVNSTIKKSDYWKLANKFKLSKNMRTLKTEQRFAKDLLEIGSGNWNNENDEMILPMNCISNGDLAEEIFGNCIISENWNELAESAILAPKNLDVSEMNRKVLDMLPGEEVVYTSIDIAEDGNRQRLHEYLDEYLNALNPSGFPQHYLKLKKHAIVLLMRNMNIEMGLCNGTRMKVEELRPNLIVCKILSGDKAGQIVYIPRVTLCCSEEYPFDLHRHQFPLVLAFAMTINKAQGQTLEKVGIDLRNDVFSHGQLYVALSRARDWKKLKIRLNDCNYERIVKNVVYKELLDNDD